jgi:xanthine dehydrogenase iron-sulfur cluster and FAD-binding subunit A
VPLADFFPAYRKTVLRPGEIMREIVLPRGGPNRGLTRRVDFLKVSKRRELDISIVAAAFCVDLAEDGTVRKARIAYGGVAAMPMRAVKAESALVGKKLNEPTVAHILHEAFKPIDDARGGAE